MSYGIVIPTFSEHECIAALLQDIQKYAPNVRIVVVDDSPDEKTAEAVRTHMTDRTFLISRKTKGGRGSAVIEGMRYLLGQGVEIIIEMDADFSHPPAQLPKLADKLVSERLDVLVASRYLSDSKIHNWPISRRIFSQASNTLARAVLGVPIHDYTNGFRCYSQRAAELVTTTCGHLGSGFIVLSEVLVNVYYRGLRIDEMPTTFVNRLRGESSLNANEIIGAIRGLRRIYKLKNQLKAGKI